jgi:hypothetical protein
MPRQICPHATARGLTIWCEHILQHTLVQTQPGNQSPQPSILSLKLPELPDMISFQSHVPLPPQLASNGRSSARQLPLADTPPPPTRPPQLASKRRQSANRRQLSPNGNPHSSVQIQPKTIAQSALRMGGRSTGCRRQPPPPPEQRTPSKHKCALKSVPRVAEDRAKINH